MKYADRENGNKTPELIVAGVQVGYYNDAQKGATWVHILEPKDAPDMEQVLKAVELYKKLPQKIKFDGDRYIVGESGLYCNNSVMIGNLEVAIDDRKTTEELAASELHDVAIDQMFCARKDVYTSERRKYFEFNLVGVFYCTPHDSWRLGGTCGLIGVRRQDWGEKEIYFLTPREINRYYKE